MPATNLMMPYKHVHFMKLLRTKAWQLELTRSSFHPLRVKEPQKERKKDLFAKNEHIAGKHCSRVRETNHPRPSSLEHNGRPS